MTSSKRNTRGVVRHLLFAGLVFVITATLVACHRDVVVVPQGVPSLGLRSASFAGDTIPKKYSSCDGGSNVSPELSWNAPPAGTQSFALIVHDRDSPLGRKFVHWVLYDLPADKRELAEGVATQPELPDGSRQGQNGFGKTGYAGPCPPGQSAHRYVFDVYALDTKLNLPAGATRKDVVKAINGHVVGWGELMGRFSK